MQIDALGKFLAIEEQMREEFSEDIQQGVESLLSDIVGEQLTQPPDNKVYVGVGKAG